MTQQEKDEIVELAVAEALELVPTSEAKAFLEGLPIGFAKVVGNLVIRAVAPPTIAVDVTQSVTASASIAPERPGPRG